MQHNQSNQAKRSNSLFTGLILKSLVLTLVGLSLTACASLDRWERENLGPPPNAMYLWQMGQQMDSMNPPVPASTQRATYQVQPQIIVQPPKPCANWPYCNIEQGY